MHRYSGRLSLPQVLGRSLLVGVSAGLRSATPIGVMAAERNDASFRAGWKNWPLLRSGAGRAALQIGWAGELIGDKLPGIPPRTNPEVLGGRVISGAIAGVAVSSEGTGAMARATGLIAGSLGALAGSYGGYTYRTKGATLTGLPDLPLALVEDFAAYVLARKGIKG